MKKFLIIVLVLLLIFAIIRIATSTYENMKREKNTQAEPVSQLSVIT